MSVIVEVYPGGLTSVYNGGTIPTSNVAVVTISRDRDSAWVNQEFAWVSERRPVETVAQPDKDWPPRWFSSIRSERTDTAARTEEILRAEFGRDDHR